MSVGPISSLDSVSTTEQVKRGSISNNLREILPANRSSLISDKFLQGSMFKCLRDLTSTGKESLIIDGRNIQDYDEKSGDLVAPSTLKKRKLLISGPDLSNHGEKSRNFSNLVKKDRMLFLQNACNQYPQEKQVLVDDKIIRGKTIELNIVKQEDGVSETVSQKSNETKGSAFLIQVKYL